MPQAKRFKRQLSALINFLKFREDMAHLEIQALEEVSCSFHNIVVVRVMIHSYFTSYYTILNLTITSILVILPMAQSRPKIARRIVCSSR